MAVKAGMRSDESGFGRASNNRRLPVSLFREEREKNEHVRVPVTK